MATKITIANNALALLGDDPISDFSEGTTRSALVRDMYENVRDSVLRMLFWNCAIKRINMSPETSSPAFGFTYQYQLPADWVRTKSISAMRDVFDYRIEGRKILTDLESIQLTYVYRNDDPSTYDAGLIDVLTFSLAAALAYPITKSTTQAQYMEQKAGAALRSAKSSDAQDDVQRDWFDESLISNRGI